MYKKKFKQHGLPCPCGQSSDAYAIDFKGDGYCFSCSKPFGNKEKIIAEKTGVEEFEYWPHRGISRGTYEFFDVKTKFVNGEPTETGFIWPSGGVRVRRVGDDIPKSDRFYSKGPMSNPGLFGQDRFDPGSKDGVVIVAGGHDALATYEMLGGKYAVVCPTSESVAKRDIANQWNYINSFKKIFICFDNDETGHRAASDIAPLFDFHKVYHVRLTTHKDPNEYLEAKEVDSFRKIFENAKRFSPDNIISSFGDIREALKKDSESQIGTYPFSSLQTNTYGLHEGEVVVVKARRGVGKQLALDTKIPTPSGWTTIADLKENAVIFGADGKSTTVTYITPVQYDVPCFKIIFNDKTSVIAGGPHRWKVLKSGKWSIKTTQEMFDHGVTDNCVNNNRSYYQVPLNKPLDLPEQNLPVDPYFLGLWLGDGHSYSANITVGGDDIDEFSKQILKRNSFLSFCKKYKNAYSVRIDGLKHSQLVFLNLLKNKHIPIIYLRSSIEQRKELLRGLMDSDGYAGPNNFEFSSSNKILADQTTELIRSLGMPARIRQKQAKLYGVDKKINYTITFSSKDKNDVFSYKRKLDKSYECTTTRTERKTIRSIIPVDSVPSRCLTVDNEDHLFLCGDGFTVTHNTELLRAIEHHLLKTTKANLGLIHLEEDTATTIKAIAGYELSVPATLPDCGLSEEDILEGYKKAVSDDEGRVHLYLSFDREDEELLFNNIRFLVAAAGCKVIVLDHITWLATGRDDDDERKKLDRISQGLKLLAKELRFCLIMISHVNAQGGTRGSANIENVANTIISLDREEKHPDPFTRSVVNIMLEKVRLGGRTGPAGKAVFNVMTGRLEELTDQSFKEIDAQEFKI